MLLVVVELRRTVVADESCAIVIVASLQLVFALVARLEEFESVGLALRDGILGCIHSLLPQLLVVGLRDEVRAVGVGEVAVPLRVAVHLGRRREEPCAGLQRLGQSLGGAAVIGADP